MTTPQCSDDGDAVGSTPIPRGILNDVSRVSCHVACAIQILCHGIPSVRSVLRRLDTISCEGPCPSEMILLQELIDFVRGDDSTPWNPQNLYEYLQDAATINPHNVGDSTRSLSCLLRLLSQQGPSWKEVLDTSVWEGETLQILEGRRPLENDDDENTSNEMQFLQRIKPATKNKPMACPLVLNFRSEQDNNYWSLRKALLEIVQPKATQGSTYPWDTISPDTYTEKVIVIPGKGTGENGFQNADNNDGDGGNDHNNSDESDSDSDSESKSDSETSDDNHWSTSKRLEIKRIPKVWLLHLDRPPVSIGKLQKFLSTLAEEEDHGAHFSKMDHIDVPLELNPFSIATTADFETKDSGSTLSKSLFLRGAIVQVTELDDTANEEDWEGGHSITLLRDPNDDASWWLIDDDKTQKISDERAMGMIGGVFEVGIGKDTNGEWAYFCASLLVYSIPEDGFSDNEAFESDIVSSWKERTLQLEANLASQKALVGKRLRVKWAKGKFYAGQITRYDASTGKHQVTYDDGDVKEYNLQKKTVEWID